MAMSSGLFNGLDTTRISSISLNSSFSFFFKTANTSSGWSTYWKGDGVSDTRKIGYSHNNDNMMIIFSAEENSNEENETSFIWIMPMV